MRIVATRDNTGIAPNWATWQAIDEDSYDGAPDAGASRVIGLGTTEAEAVADLLEQFDWGEDWQRQAAREWRADNGQFGVGA